MFWKLEEHIEVKIFMILTWTKPEPLIKRNLRFEVSERINFLGQELEPLNENEVIEIISKLKEKKIRAVAVCLMHSYANPAHEIKIKEIINREWPEAYVSISADINPQFRNTKEHLLP